jgi:PmbA protein
MTYQEFFELAQSKGISNIQITEDEKKENSIYLINNKLEDYTDCEKKVYTIKAELNGKTENLTTEYLSESIIELILEKIHNTESNYEDEYLINKNNNIIKKIESVDVTEEKKNITDLYIQKEKFPLTKSLEIAYSDTYTKTRIINSNKVDISTDSHCYELYVEASAEKDETIATYSESLLVTDKSKIDFLNIINNVLNLTSLATVKKKLETKKYNIILSNKVASRIIDHIQGMLSAELIHQKKSCLINKLNEKVFSEKLNIVEEPINKEYPGYIIFDKEGTDTYNKDVITNGIIKTYLYDIKEAKIDKVKSTGNKYNGIAARNMYIKPGNKSLSELFKDIDNGIYITHYMGSMGSSINESTGNISMQVFGYIIENGNLICGFEPAVLTSSIFELLTNIEEIGSDLQFVMKSSASPSIYIKDISIAGE